MKSTEATDSSVATGDGSKKKKKEVEPMASPSEVMAFVFSCGRGTTLIFLLGCLAGVGNGAVYPILAYLFSNSFSSISGASSGLSEIREIAFTFMIVGAYALVCATFQTGCFEIASSRATRSFRRQWFSALLRQDAAFFDVYDIAGVANTIGPSSNKFRRGTGRKFGEGIQFMTTFLGGIGFAFYSSWRVALVILGALPFCSLTALAAVSLNQKKSANAAVGYRKAGSVAYSTVSAIRTVLSLNAIPEMVRLYSEATLEAFKDSIGVLIKMGAANGGMLGTFLILYCILAMFGSFLIYRDVDGSGCDPSGSVDGNQTCPESATDVFGAMLGVAFAAQGLSQVSNFFESFTGARVACRSALSAINRKPGASQIEIYADSEEELSSTKHGTDDEASEMELGEDGKRVKAILPEYNIDSSSSNGMKPDNIKGSISFKNVHFFYPTRPGNLVLTGLDLEIEAGKTVAIVGPSGGGKSTTVSLIERFYDPTTGSVELDGTNLRDINVHHLRSLIGYVGQEPTLFATTIAGNIQYGKPGATQEEIEAAAKMANAHDFISSFPDGYLTQVGDKGAQLSGGQKQRIAIARVLVANPKILLLDEATSALDSESEIVVQDALDNVVAEHKRTTVVIAHRLSTIRNADVIVVVTGGKVVEKGTHEELMEAATGHYRSLVEKQEKTANSGSPSISRETSSGDLNKRSSVISDKQFMAEIGSETPHFHFMDVKFAYPTRPTKRVLDGFSLAVRQGETVALVGPSGGGKSTVVALVERFYDPLEGSVQYMGVDVKSLNVGWYRDQIGYVGQEPTLFNTSIAKNIAYGHSGATMEEIIEAAKQANAHEFISSFADGYDTEIGATAQLSGGQKQRIAIARALVKKPKVLLLDEATSALDSESEVIVQEALDKIMQSKDHTIIVIAHRLSTIRNADRIAFIAHGGVKEFGSHDELMEMPHGRYKRLVETQRRGSVIDAAALKHSLKDLAKDDEEKEDDDTIDTTSEVDEKEKSAFNAKRAREMAKPDASYMLLGSVGAVLAGGVFPVWGLMFAETIELLFRRVEDCDEASVEEVFGFLSCSDYYSFVADDMRDTSFRLGGYWIALAAACVIGNMLVFYGFGMASERLNKRVRDSSFIALVRQEVAFFDHHSVGSITSQLEDDAARIHAFSGEPVRSMIVALSSVLTGVILSFVFMWPFALLALACVPLLGFATSIEMKQFLGEDEGTGNAQDELNSAGGVAVETLLNIRTVAALNLEKERLKNYEGALTKEQPHYMRDGFISGGTSGLSMFIQQWINALQLWWGGWLLFNYSDVFGFKDFVVSMFSLLFALFGLGAAFQGLSDKKEMEKSAGRIFHLLDRKSAIDPLSDKGKKLE